MNKQQEELKTVNLILESLQPAIDNKWPKATNVLVEKNPDANDGYCYCLEGLILLKWGFKTIYNPYLESYCFGHSETEVFISNVIPSWLYGEKNYKPLLLPVEVVEQVGREAGFSSDFVIKTKNKEDLMCSVSLNDTTNLDFAELKIFFQTLKKMILDNPAKNFFYWVEK